MKDELDRARGIATATLADALDACGLDGVMTGLTRRCGSGRVAGHAVTAREQVLPLGTYGLADFAVGPVFDGVPAGSVLVIDMGGADVSTFGGLAALTLARRRAQAVLVDGACRDLEDIRATGLTVASRHVTPKTGKGRVKVVSRGEPVLCGGVTVRQGDLIVGDETGFVVIPAGRIGEVLEIAAALDARDQRFAEALQAGKSFAETAERLRHA